MFKELYTYELILLLAGFLLFLTLLVLVIIQTTKEKKIRPLLLFFLPAIIMMGYPGIQSFSISKDKFELTKVQEKLMSDPENEKTKEELARLTKAVEKRAKTDEDYVQLSKSYLMLDENEKALEASKEAIAINANNQGAQQIESVAHAKVQLDQASELTEREKQSAVDALKNSTWLNNHQAYRNVILEKYKPFVRPNNKIELNTEIRPINP